MSDEYGVYGQSKIQKQESSIQKTGTSRKDRKNKRTGITTKHRQDGDAQKLSLTKRAINTSTVKINEAKPKMVFIKSQFHSNMELP
ncbi:MAG: hypothetical protein ACOYXT_07735, partial [Bacteroidota bacterium]